MRRGQPRILIVRRAQGWEAQLWSGSRLVWFTQRTYNDRRGAVRAVDTMRAAVQQGATDHGLLEDVDDR